MLKESREKELNTEKLRNSLRQSDAVIIGAGSGLSSSAGFTYTGERFEMYFSDFAEKYPIRDMYSGGFYPFSTMGEFWGWWSRHIWVNRYMDPPKPVYKRLKELVKDKDYFVITTNVDHCFQKAGFDKRRLFYTQGDYGLLQCSKPCHNMTYDNKAIVQGMVESQGFTVAEDGTLTIPEGAVLKMSIPEELIPHCPVCGRIMSMNLRSDDTFAEDSTWHEHEELYEDFLQRHKNVRTLFLDLGTGGNTPGIIKIPFIKMAYEWPKATYACINYGEAFVPDVIRDKSICINADIGEILDEL